ncbi:MAG TPA: dUTP diphosphatase [Opitutus sp.]|nr:dUTP diphosphatase [Opitutus sp.]
MTALSLAIEVPCRIKLIDERAQVPAYAHASDTGADLFAVEHTAIMPGETRAVDIGIAIELAPGYCAEIRPRSSQSKRGILVHTGTLDWSYRGSIRVLITNGSEDIYRISPGDRIGQMVVAPVHQARFSVVSELGETARADGGLGSTGV